MKKIRKRKRSSSPKCLERKWSRTHNENSENCASKWSFLKLKMTSCASRVMPSSMRSRSLRTKRFNSKTIWSDVNRKWRNGGRKSSKRFARKDESWSVKCEPMHSTCPVASKKRKSSRYVNNSKLHRVTTSNTPPNSSLRWIDFVRSSKLPKRSVTPSENLYAEWKWPRLIGNLRKRRRPRWWVRVKLKPPHFHSEETLLRTRDMAHAQRMPDITLYRIRCRHGCTNHLDLQRGEVTQRIMEMHHVMLNGHLLEVLMAHSLTRFNNTDNSMKNYINTRPATPVHHLNIISHSNMQQNHN
mmetsp:Transcript_5578/g.20985  ORF Transcript_5578/g.20985 Transcript_5578/m.20985 type:complete len:299 (-) Transcript_5578:444-1340(-)